MSERLAFEHEFDYHLCVSSPLDLSPAALLAAEEAGVRARRQGEVEAMERLLAWCDLNADDPQGRPGAVPVSRGGDRSLRVGSEGTPEVAELCFAEFAIAAHAGVAATMTRAGDLLDLRHRMPRLYDAVRALRLEVWVARKVVVLARRLSPAQVGLVDVAVARAADESPSRIIRIAEAKVIEADVEAHAARLRAEAARTGVWLRRKRPGARVDDLEAQADVQTVALRLSTAGAEGLAETIDHLAELLALHRPAQESDEDEQAPTADALRAQAAELLADPAAALRLLDGSSPPDHLPARPNPGKVRRRRAVVHVHLHHDVLSGAHAGIARVEDIGPLLLAQVRDLLRGRDVVVQPVVDLQHTHAVNAYEHPAACRVRTLLRTTRDVFPHSARRAISGLDHDHPTPYVPGGAAGQTGDHNDAPLARREHRATTHLAYRVRQLGLGAYRWETPHGLGRVVTPAGTRVVELLRDDTGTVIGELYPP